MGRTEILSSKVIKFSPTLRNKIRVLRRGLFGVQNILTRRLLNLSIWIFPTLFSKIVFANEVTVKKDGTGAQIQRLLATASLAGWLGSGFSQSKLIDVAVHPLDNLQDTKSYTDFMERLNSLFQIRSSSTSVDFAKTYFVKDVKLARLFIIAIKSHFTNGTVKVFIENPFTLSDLDVSKYSNVIKKLDNVFSEESHPKVDDYIAIHYRQGVGNFVIYPGQSIPRQIEISYFRDCINKLAAKKDLRSHELHIFTDAPDTVISFQPPKEQQYLWEGTPGYSNGLMTIQPLKFVAEDFGVKKIVVHSGGDPITAILKMARASILITGRSSLSYVAGLLNVSGIVVSAPEFWHPPLSHWIACD